MSISLLLADDQPLIRRGLRLMLESEPDLHVAAEAEDGHEAVDLAVVHRPQVVLMDVRMPRLDGIEATRRICAHPGLRATSVLMLTTYDADEYVFAALRAGACGFVLKHITPEELVGAVRATASGGGLISPSLTRRLIATFAQMPSADSAGAPPVALEELSAREIEVLTLMGRGLSNPEIAAHLFLGESTVKTHVRHILTKLGLRDRVHAVIRAYEAGLVRPRA